MNIYGEYKSFHLLNGVGVFVLELCVEFRVNPTQDEVPCFVSHVAGVIEVERHNNRYYIGEAFFIYNPVVQVASTQETKFQGRLRLPLDRYQMASLEQLREGGDVNLKLECSAVAYRPTTHQVLAPVHNISVNIRIPQSDWVNQLNRIKYRETSLVELPSLPLPPEIEQMLREAHDHLALGRTDLCVGEVRKVVERYVKLNPKLKPVKDKSDKEKTKVERYGDILEVLRTPAHLPHHADDVAYSTDWSRTDALAILVSVSSFITAYEIDKSLAT